MQVLDLYLGKTMEFQHSDIFSAIGAQKNHNQDSSFASTDSNGQVSAYTALMISSRLSVPSMLVDAWFLWLWLRLRSGLREAFPPLRNIPQQDDLIAYAFRKRAP
jgi:hypothetical protein